MDSKSIGLCPQGFESLRCRYATIISSPSSLSLSLSLSDSLVDSLSDSLSDSLVDSLSDSLVGSLSLILSLILRNGLTVVGEIRRTSHKTSEMAVSLSGRSIGAPSEIRIALTTIEGAEWTQNGRGAVAAQP